MKQQQPPAPHHLLSAGLSLFSPSRHQRIKGLYLAPRGLRDQHSVAPTPHQPHHLSIADYRNYGDKNCHLVCPYKPVSRKRYLTKQTGAEAPQPLGWIRAWNRMEHPGPSPAATARVCSIYITCTAIAIWTRPTGTFNSVLYTLPVQRSLYGPGYSIMFQWWTGAFNSVLQTY